MTTQEMSLVETKLKGAKERLVAVSPVSRKQAERAADILVTLARRELKDCSLNSVLLAALGVAKLGLNPDPQLGHVWIIPFRDGQTDTKVATVIIGYRGMIELGRRGGLKSIRAERVYANDLFEYENGLSVHLRHVPWWMRGQAEPGPMRAAYVLASTNGLSSEYVTVLPVSELDKARERSKSAKAGFSPWNTDTDAMRLKTAVRRASKLWPMTPELASAVALDERDEIGDPQDIYDLSEIEDASEPLPEGKRIMAGKKKDEPGKSTGIINLPDSDEAL